MLAAPELGHDPQIQCPPTIPRPCVVHKCHTEFRRYLTLPACSTNSIFSINWVAVPHLASHILGRMARRISQDWERIYGHPIYFLETFIDPERFRGTCYRAANRVVLGRTTGRGKDDRTQRPNRPIKEVLALPLHRRFHELLGAE